MISAVVLRGRCSRRSRWPIVPTFRWHAAASEDREWPRLLLHISSGDAARSSIFVEAVVGFRMMSRISSHPQPRVSG